MAQAETSSHYARNSKTIVLLGLCSALLLGLIFVIARSGTAPETSNTPPAPPPVVPPQSEETPTASPSETPATPTTTKAPSKPSPSVLPPPSATIMTEGTIEIWAEKNAFHPSSFKILHFAPVSLLINAVDRDYIFRILESGVDVTIRKETSVVVSLADLGVGSHIFDCGPGCTGTVTVVGESD